jgi:hypothetical protein
LGLKRIVTAVLELVFSIASKMREVGCEVPDFMLRMKAPSRFGITLYYSVVAYVQVMFYILKMQFSQLENLTVAYDGSQMTTDVAALVAIPEDVR